MQEGFTKLSQKTHISRELLYKVLNKKSNPKIKTLLTILKAFDFSLYVKKEPIFLDDLFPKVMLMKG
jgi:DNA-binding phage protein